MSDEIEKWSKQPMSRPWQVVREMVPCLYGPIPHTRIFTAWDHPQLEGPAPIVNQAFSVAEDGKSRVYTVSIRDADADFIVKACNEYDALIAERDHLRQELDDAKTIALKVMAQTARAENQLAAARQSRRRLVWWIHEVGRRDDLLDDAIEAMNQAQQDARELANALHFMLLLWASVDAEHKVMAAPAKEELMKIVDVEWSIGAKYLEQPPSESDS